MELFKNLMRRTKPIMVPPMPLPIRRPGRPRPLPLRPPSRDFLQRKDLLDKITGDVLMPVERKPFVQELRPSQQIGTTPEEIAALKGPGSLTPLIRVPKRPIPPQDFGFGPGIRPTEIRGPDGRIIGPAGVTPPGGVRDPFVPPPHL